MRFGVLTLTSLSLISASVLDAASARAEGAKLAVMAPLPVVLGEVATIPVTIDVADTPETEGRPLQVTVNVGRIDSPERVGPGKYQTEYHLPATKFPQVAIVAVWRETGANAEVEFLRIPLSARTRLPYKTKPGAQVRVAVGEERFGPVTADRKGQATIPIVVPPGVGDVEVETILGLAREKARVAVKVPPYNRLGMAVVPYMVAPDGTGSAVAHVFYDKSKTPSLSDVQLKAPGCDVAPVSGKEGHYQFTIKPQAGAVRELKVSTTVNGDNTSSAQTLLMMGTPKPERIVDRSGGLSLVADGAATKVLRVLVIDPAGVGVPKLALNVEASAGKIGEVRDVGNGFYEATLTAPDAVPRKRKITVDFSVVAASRIALAVDTQVLGGGSGAVASKPTNTPAAAVVTPDGSATVETPAPTSTSGPTMTLGAKVGGTFDAALGPMFGIEVGYRPAAFDHRLAVALSVAFKTMSGLLPMRALGGGTESMTRLPILLGLSYDFYAQEDVRIYAGIAAGVVGVANKVEVMLQESATIRRLKPTGELTVGASYSGAFIEVGGFANSVKDLNENVPSVGASAAIGYRLGLF